MKLSDMYAQSKAVIDQIEQGAVHEFRIEQFETTTSDPAHLSVIVSYMLARDMQFTSELNPTQIKTDRIHKELRFDPESDELIGMYVFEP